MGMGRGKNTRTNTTKKKMVTVTQKSVEAPQIQMVDSVVPKPAMKNHQAPMIQKDQRTVNAHQIESKYVGGPVSREAQILSTIVFYKNQGGGNGKTKRAETTTIKKTKLEKQRKGNNANKTGAAADRSFPTLSW